MTYNYFKFNDATDRNVTNYKKTIDFSSTNGKYEKALKLFDTNGNGKMESNEIADFWNFMKYYASKNGRADILDNAEGECFIKETNDYNTNTFDSKYYNDSSMKKPWRKTFAFCQMEAIDLKVSELIAFANAIANTVNKETHTCNCQYDREMEELEIERMKQENLQKLTAEVRDPKRNPNLSDKEIDGWNDIIVREAKRYNFPPEIIEIIIGKECHYVESSIDNHGCMQVFSCDTIRNSPTSFRPLDEKLYDDTLKALKTKNLKDKQTGIKAGIITFKSSFIYAVADELGYAGPAWKKYEAAMKDYKDGKIHLTEEQAERVIRNALQIYNAGYDNKNISSAKNYAEDCMKRLKKIGYDFTSAI